MDSKTYKNIVTKWTDAMTFPDDFIKTFKHDKDFFNEILGNKIIFNEIIKNQKRNELVQYEFKNNNEIRNKIINNNTYYDVFITSHEFNKLMENVLNNLFMKNDEYKYKLIMSPMYKKYFSFDKLINNFILLFKNDKVFRSKIILNNNYYDNLINLPKLRTLILTNVNNTKYNEKFTDDNKSENKYKTELKNHYREYKKLERILYDLIYEKNSCVFWYNIVLILVIFIVLGIYFWFYHKI